MMKTQQQINNEISLVAKYPRCLAWKNFTNHCWQCDPDPEEHYTIAQVRVALSRDDARYLPLMKTVAAILEARWITYDKLTEVLGRIISLGEHQDFIRLIRQSVTIRISQGLPVR